MKNGERPPIDDAQLLADLRHAGQVLVERASKDRDVFLVAVSGLMRVAADRLDQLTR